MTQDNVIDLESLVKFLDSEYPDRLPKEVVDRDELARLVAQRKMIEHIKIVVGYKDDA